MIEIKDLLFGWSGVLLQEENKIESIRAAVSDTIGVEIKKEDIKIKNNTVFLDMKPIYKSEIFLKKGEILSRLENSIGKLAPGDIR
ncbi:hypothetical protein HYZ82_00330 [Candidatus Nomurabacteria bacterium]|nr:hypothetical protein [Candidatus Nomurabacteria bacterium]